MSLDHHYLPHHLKICNLHLYQASEVTRSITDRLQITVDPLKSPLAFDTNMAWAPHSVPSPSRHDSEDNVLIYTADCNHSSFYAAGRSFRHFSCLARNWCSDFAYFDWKWHLARLHVHGVYCYLFYGGIGIGRCYRDRFGRGSYIPQRQLDTLAPVYCLIMNKYYRECTLNHWDSIIQSVLLLQLPPCERYM